MEGALSGIQAVIVIFVLIGIGMFVSWRKWVTPDVAKAFPRIIINIAMPCTVVSSLYGNFVAADETTQAQNIAPWIPLVIAFAALIVSFLLALLVARILRVPRERRGVFTVLFSFSNSVFIGFPVAQALFGDPGMTYAVYYYIANTTCFWTIGYIMIRRDADFLHGETSRIGVAEILRKLATPPLIAILITFGVILTGLRLPSFVLDICKYGGGLTTPLSLLFTGCMIYEAGLSGIKYEKGMGTVLLGRFALTPALCFGVCILAILLLKPGMPQANVQEITLMRNVLTVQTGLPVMTQSVIVAQHYGADARFATRGMVWTALASLLTIPLTVLLFQVI